MTTRDMPIARLRRISVALERGAPVAQNDGAWFADAVKRYEALAGDGLTLERALGLVPMPGNESWWTIEARAKRDAAIQALAANHFADVRISRKARRIAKDGADYQASAWRHDRDRADLVGSINDPKRCLLAAALSTGLPFPKARHIENILRNERSSSNT